MCITPNPNNMKLQEFISATIKEIIDGVTDAQAYGKTKGARVSPNNLLFRNDQGHNIFWDGETGEIATVIDFDVAVTTSEGTGTKGGIGIVVGPIALGSQGKSDASKSSESRIKFTIPIQLPKT